MPAQKDEKGQILVMTALMFTVLVFFTGLAIDGSFAWVKQRESQNAADFAAIAGANALRTSADEDDATRHAVVKTAIESVLDANGSDAGLGEYGAEYTNQRGIAYSPSQSVGSGAIPADAGGVRVVASRAWRPFFNIWGDDEITASAAGAARYKGSTTLGEVCVLCAIGAGSSPSLSITSGATVNVIEGSVISNQGINTASNSDLTLRESGASVRYSGSDTSSPGTVSPAPIDQGEPVDDPYAFLSDPVMPSGSATVVNVTSGTTTIDPGLYSSLSVKKGPANNPGVLELRPGTYYINGSAGVNCESGGTIKGTGVTIILFDPAPFNANSQCMLDLTAPLSDQPASAAIPYPGMLIYAERTNEATIGLYSGSDTRLAGSIYAKAGSLVLQSGNVESTAIRTMIVVGNAELSANSTITIVYDASVNVPIETMTPVLLVQ